MLSDPRVLEADPQVSGSDASDGVRGIDHIVMYVGNARQTAHFYRTICGFTPVAYAGLETGDREHCSYVLQQNDIRLVVTSALRAESPAAAHVHRHGESVCDVALGVGDVEAAYARAIANGAAPIQAPRAQHDADGEVTTAIIGGRGSVRHTLVGRNGYGGPFLPGFKPLPGKAVPSIGLDCIDHVAFSVEEGQIQQWVDFYGAVLGFEQTFAEDVETARTAMRSRVIEDKGHHVRFPITEPRPAKARSQIEEYLAYHDGPGAQHAAFGTRDMIAAARTLRANGLEFLSTPGTYYDALPGRVGMLEEPMETLRELEILVDRDASGYLLQVFTKPLETRPTFFLEVIQRKGAQGFGAGNVRALFEAVEREQALRGNLH